MVSTRRTGARAPTELRRAVVVRRPTALAATGSLGPTVTPLLVLQRAFQRIVRRADDSSASSSPSFDETVRERITLLRDGPLDGDVLDTLLAPPAGTVDAHLRVLFPELRRDAVDLIDDEPAPPDSWARIAGKRVRIDGPIDWGMDPWRDRGGRRTFQSLSWLGNIDSADDDIRTQASIVWNWADAARNGVREGDLAWDQHAVASRLTHVRSFVTRYSASGDVVSRPAIEAAAWIVLTHVYALADRRTYSERHNHGVMQDRALLRALRELPGLADRTTLISLAEHRLRTLQVERCVTRDWGHTENSPHYHLFFVRLLSEIIADLYAAYELPPPAWLIEPRDRMLGTLLPFVQPNGTLPQFGDTLNEDVGTELQRIQERARRSVALPAELDRNVTFVATRGASGAAPSSTDQVLPRTGYACFRDSWQGLGDVTLHVKASRLASVHVHHDETSFELFGHDREVIVDSGRYSNDRSSELAVYSIGADAHNVLVVNRRSMERVGERARIVSSHTGTTQSWVVCEHHYYADQGVRGYQRMFVLDKGRGALVVVDLLLLEREVQTVRHLHVHPDFTLAEDASNRVEACLDDGRGIAVELWEDGSTFSLRRGEDGPSFYFPAERTAIPMTDAACERSLPAGAHALVTSVDLDPTSRRATPPLRRSASGRLRVAAADGSQPVELPERWQPVLAGWRPH